MTTGGSGTYQLALLSQLISHSSQQTEARRFLLSVYVIF